MRRIPKEFRLEEGLQLISLSIFGYLLYRPIIGIFAQLTELPSGEQLHWYFFATVLLAFFIQTWYIVLPLQLFFIGMVLHHYFPVSEIGFSWLEAKRSQLIEAWIPFYRGRSAVFPTIVAVVLFIVVIGVGIHLLLRKKPSLLIAFGIGYLLFLHTFTAYDLSIQMAKSLAIGFVLLGLSRIPTHFGVRAFLLPALAVSVFAGLFYSGSRWLVDETTEQQQWALDESKSFQNWLDERGFFDRIDHFRKDGGLKQMGFSEDDSQIGGAIRPNFEEVFYAYDDTPHYWKVMNKEIYNGSGWESYPDQSFYSYKFDPESEENFISVQIERKNDFEYYPYPVYGYVTSTDEQSFAIQSPSERFIFEEGEESISYEVFFNPSFNQNPTDPDLEYTEQEEIQATPYLQLPDLSDEIWELSRTIVTDGMSPYEKAVRIEEYLRNEAGLRYSLRDAPSLPPDVEPIAHFLFESKVGYCDHFSSAMVLLLRMNGVPARWTKGFTAGTEQTFPNGFTYRVITNSNAHSWPEVYLPETGWVSFEPTPAFSSRRGDTIETDDTDIPLVIEESESLPTADNESVVEESVTGSDTAIEEVEEEEVEMVEIPLIQWIGASLGVMVLVFLYFKRGVLARLLLQIPVDWFDWKVFMVRSLLMSTFPMNPNETYRQYGERLASRLPYHQNQISAFIHLLENRLYSDTKNNHPEEYQQILLDMITVRADLKSLNKRDSYA